MIQKIKEDFNVNYSLLSKIFCLNYRIGNKLFLSKTPIIKPILRLVSMLIYLPVTIITQCSILPYCKIGRRLILEHGGNGIVIHPDVEIGDDFRVFHQVTIGLKDGGVPKIGSNVFIGPGAKLFGKITIGDNVKIGANAVVTKSIPDNCTAVGIPAKIIYYKC